MRIMENENKNGSCFGGDSMPKYAAEILAAVTEFQRHPTAEQVFLEMKREHPSIALGTVYLPCLPGAGKRQSYGGEVS